MASNRLAVRTPMLPTSGVVVSVTPGILGGFIRAKSGLLDKVYGLWYKMIESSVNCW
jgi:hypothetical protein